MADHKEWCSLFSLCKRLDQIGIATLPRSTEHLVFRGGDELRVDATLLAAAVADPNDIGIALKYEVE